MQNSLTQGQEEEASGQVLTGIRAYLLSVFCVGLALLLRLALDPLWKDRLPYGTFFVAVIVVTQFADVGPTIFAAIAGFLLSAWFFVTPRQNLMIDGTLNQVNAILYFVLCFVVLFFSLRVRRALVRERTAREALGRLAAIIESSDDAIIGKSIDGNIISWNAGARKLFGYTEAEARGKSIAFLVAAEFDKELGPVLEHFERSEHISHFETTRRKKDGGLVQVSLSISPIRNSVGQIVGISTIARNIEERKQAELERERLVGELQKALGEVKTLSGLFPLCAYCKKIRDDKGYWSQIEHYLRHHSSANFTHCICPECARHHFADFYKDGRLGQ